jgi:hypothetical protein
MSQTIAPKKVVLKVTWGTDGFHVVDMMPSGGRFNTECILTLIMDRLLAKGFPLRKQSRELRLCVHLDNC